MGRLRRFYGISGRQAPAGFSLAYPLSEFLTESFLDTPSDSVAGAQTVALGVAAEATSALPVTTLNNAIPAVIYDGAFDFLKHTGGPAGATDGTTGTVVWAGTFSSDGSAMTLFDIPGTVPVKLERQADNTIDLVVGTAGAVCSNSTAAVASSLGFLIVLASFNGTASYLYVIHSAGTITGVNTAGASATVDFTADWFLGADGGTSNFLDADTSMWWADDSFIDFSIANNREEFWDTTTGLLRAPGSDGSNPSGSQPLVCHAEMFATHTTNRGSGGNADTGSVSEDGISPGTYAADFVAEYTANAWTFDGTNDYLEAGGADTADRNICIISFWFRINTLNRGQYLWGGYNIFRPFVRLSSSNQLRVRISGNGTILRWEGDVVGGVISDNDWHHFCMSWDSSTFTTTDDLTTRLDGVAYSLSTSASAAGATEMNLNTFVGAVGNGVSPPIAGSRLDGDIAEFFLHSNLASYFDLDVAGNIEKFRTDAGKPEDLGADGSTPLGVQPNNYLKNPAASANVNSGARPDWTLAGTLDAAASSPSD